jgi:hypothetical protein
MAFYQIPHIVMVDVQYNGSNPQSDNFVILDNKLEHELKAVGWRGVIDTSIDPDDAYNFVWDAIQNSNKEMIRSIKVGQIFDKVIKGIGENPDKIWASK